MVELLLKEHVLADINIQVKDGQTALVIDSTNDHYEVVESLIKEKADSQFQDKR